MRLAPLGLIACAHHDPVDVLGRYLEAEQSGRYPTAWGLLTEQDHAARDLDAWANDHLQAGPIWLACAARTSFRVVDSQLTSESALVTIAATHPSIAAVSQAVSVPVGSLDLQVDHVVSALTTTTFPISTEHIPYALRREGRQWRVWLGLAEQDAAVRHAADALAARERGDPAGELAALRQLVTLPQDPSGAVALLQEEARTRIVTLSAPGTP